MAEGDVDAGANTAATEKPTTAAEPTTTDKPADAAAVEKADVSQTTTSATAEAGREDEYNPEEEVVDGNWNRPEIEVHEVKVHSGEEEEEVVWKHRAKLYRWAPDVAEPETFLWKERGLGEAKLLRHKTTQRIRFLLRQEKTLKIVANHYVLPQYGMCALRPNAGSDKIWVWSVNDFADGETKLEKFALKFGQVEQANEFKEKFEECCRMNADAFGVEAEGLEPKKATTE